MPEKPSQLLPALYGGLVMGIMFGVPYLNYANCACCAPVILGGFLSVFFYKNNLKEGMSPLTSSDGLQLGSISGVIGGVIAFSLSRLFQFLSDKDPRAEMENALEQMRGRPGEQMIEAFASLMDSPFYIILSFVMTIVICVLFGLIGGLIGSSVFKPKQPMMNMQPPPAPPTQS